MICKFGLVEGLESWSKEDGKAFQVGEELSRKARGQVGKTTRICLTVQVRAAGKVDSKI